MSITVYVKQNNVEKALRQLKRKLLKDGIMRTLKEKQYYEKPSDKRVRKQKENVKRALKAKKLRERDL